MPLVTPNPSLEQLENPTMMETLLTLKELVMQEIIIKMIELLIPRVTLNPKTIKRIHNKLIQHFIITQDMDEVINIHDGTLTKNNTPSPTIVETTMMTPITTTHMMPLLTTTSLALLPALPITRNLNEDIEVYNGDYVTNFNPEELNTYKI